MTRLVLACLGTGYLLGVATLALFGNLTCAALGFVSGMAFLACVIVLALCGLYGVGKRLGWIDSFTPSHSQTLTPSPESRSVEL